eukprot:6179955-Pleurochrysis_carterae.AAC.3
MAGVLYGWSCCSYHEGSPAGAETHTRNDAGYRERAGKKHDACAHFPALCWPFIFIRHRQFAIGPCELAYIPPGPRSRDGGWRLLCYLELVRHVSRDVSFEAMQGNVLKPGTGTRRSERRDVDQSITELLYACDNCQKLTKHGCKG